MPAPALHRNSHPLQGSLAPARLLVATSRPQNVVFSGVLTAVLTAIDGQLRRGMLCYVLLWLLYAVAATYNNLHDAATDKLNRRTDNPLASGQLSRQFAVVWIFVNLAAVIVVQFWLVQPLSLITTAAYAGLLLAYSHPGLRLQARGFIAPIVLGLCYAGAPVILGTGQSGAADWVLAGLLTLLCVPLLLAKDYKDLAGDRATGKRTALVRYGAKTVRLVSLALAVCGCLAVIIYLALESTSTTTEVIISGACLVAYIYSVWYVHTRQTRRSPYFLRLPQLALVVLAGCLATIS